MPYAIQTELKNHEPGDGFIDVGSKTEGMPWGKDFLSAMDQKKLTGHDLGRAVFEWFSLQALVPRPAERACLPMRMPLRRQTGMQMQTPTQIAGIYIGI